METNYGRGPAWPRVGFFSHESFMHHNKAKPVRLFGAVNRDMYILLKFEFDHNLGELFHILFMRMSFDIV